MFKISVNLRSDAITQLISHIRVPLYQNSYALIFSDGATSMLGIVFWVLATRYFTTDQVGRNSATISTMMLLAGLASVHLKGAMLRFIPRAGQMTRKLVGYAYVVSAIMALVISLIFILGYVIWAPAQSFLDGGWLFMLWFLFATITWCLFTVQDFVLTGLRQARWVPIKNVSFGIAKIVLLLLFAYWLPRHSVFASWTVTVPLLVLLVNLLIFRRLIPRRIADTESQSILIAPRRIVKFVASDYLGALFWMIATLSLPLIVINGAGATANAYFYLAWMIAFQLHLIASNVAASLTVEGAMDEAKLDVYVRQVLIHIARVLLPLIIVVLIGAPYILRVFGEDYAAAGSTLLRLLALTALPYSINAVFMGRARVQNRIGRIVLLQGAVCILMLSSSHILLRRYGINGMGVAWLASQTLVAVVVLLTQLGTQLHPIFNYFIRIKETLLQ